MGLLDDLFGQATPGGNVAQPLMIALGTLLVGKMLSPGQTANATGAPAPAGMPDPSAAAQAGAALDPNAAAGAGLGGLGSLLEKLQAAGHGDTVNSWLGGGQNAPIDPQHLGSALGQTTVSNLAQQSGMNEQELLSQLASALPGLVDKLSPNGQLPALNEIAGLFRQ